MDHPSFQRLIGLTDVMKDLVQRTYMAARTDLTVLIQGERGTGKEFIALALHETSRRANHNLVAVNSASFDGSLGESLLFGYVRGSYTGADRDTKGKFELAHLGTLFLDEIAQLKLEIQAKLLRVLETGVIDKVGSEKPLRVDVRVIAATNQDLKAMAEQGTFLPDLYDRLNVFSITTPPLRDRLADIPLLLQHFLDEYSSKTTVRAFSPEVLKLFQSYSWPGNVRELRNLVRPLLALAEKDVIDVGDMPAKFLRDVEKSPSPDLTRLLRKQPISKEICVEALAAAGDNRSKAAKLLGISRAHFYRIIKMYGL